MHYLQIGKANASQVKKTYYNVSFRSKSMSHMQQDTKEPKTIPEACQCLPQAEYEGIQGKSYRIRSHPVIIKSLNVKYVESPVLQATK